MHVKKRYNFVMFIREVGNITTCENNNCTAMLTLDLDLNFSNVFPVEGRAFVHK